MKFKISNVLERDKKFSRESKFVEIDDECVESEEEKFEKLFSPKRENSLLILSDVRKETTMLSYRFLLCACEVKEIFPL